MKERPILMSDPMVRATLAGLKTQTRRVAIEPIKVQLDRRVGGDWPIGHHTIAEPGIYAAHLNPYGAVSVMTKSGKLLGLKPGEFKWVSPYGQPGDRLWVRETWALIWTDYEPDWENGETGWDVPHQIEYRADTNAKYPGDWPDDAGNEPGCAKWMASIFMPRKVSRIMLGIENIRLERLQAMTEDDAVAEGVGSGFLCNAGWPDYQHINNGICTLTQDTARMSFASLFDSINTKRGINWEVNPWVWVIEFQLIKDSFRR